MNQALSTPGISAAGEGARHTGTERLLAMGFRKCGEWIFDAERLRCSLSEHASATNVLYAFIVQSVVVYVGKTVQPLGRRMYGYQNPVATQSTNIKGHAYIRAALQAGHAVEIHALPDNGLLYYGGFHVNLAAGLEDSLLANLKPPWNRAGI